METTILPCVLIAEDDKSNYDLAHFLLKNKFRVIHAWDGDEAITLCKEERPSIVLMDINMPNVNGIEAMHAIKQIYPDICVVALTAYAMSDDETKMLNEGFDGYVSKPINISTFQKIISRFIEP